MKRLSALGIAGALLLAAGSPALAQAYPVDPGYDQGPDYGPPGAPDEDLPPGLNYGPGPVYGGADEGPGPYGGDQYGYGGPDGYPAYGDEQWRRHHHRHDNPQGRYGNEFRHGDEAFGGEGPRRPERDVGRDRGRRDRNAEQHRRRPHPSGEDMSDQQ